MQLGVALVQHGLTFTLAVDAQDEIADLYCSVCFGTIHDLPIPSINGATLYHFVNHQSLLNATLHHVVNRSHIETPFSNLSSTQHEAKMHTTIVKPDVRWGPLRCCTSSGCL